MSIKCFYHPRVDGALACRGCKLPACDTCRQPCGLCKACAKTREAVQDLRELRQVAASKAGVASSNTAQLRLALRQVGPIARREGRSTVALSPTRRPLTPADWQATAMRVEARPSTAAREALARNKGQWTYDPARVAYRAVKVHRAAPTSRTVWLQRFLGGFAAALAVVLATSVGTGALLRATHHWFVGHGKASVTKVLERPVPAR